MQNLAVMTWRDIKYAIAALALTLAMDDVSVWCSSASDEKPNA
jgi:alpha-D-ribose 1-methylphosphonate 5-triphosphate synthase subunit PhnH